VAPKPAAKTASEDETATLLKQLLAIELWRGGLSQSEIRKRLGVGMNVVNEWLKGVSREIRAKQVD
jgi:transposase